jgi:site-specific DNA-cytosine methylase
MLNVLGATDELHELLNDVLDDLQGLAPTWQAQPYRRPATWWSEPRRSASGSVDGHQGLDNPLTRRMLDLLQGVDWPAGHSIAQVARSYYDKYGKLPDSWQATQEKIIKNDFFMGFTTPVRWDGQRYGRVITGGGLHNVIHPRLNRTITHREAARILGFPDDWKILPLRGVSGLNMTWGKGITVDCGRWIGRWIKRALDGEPGSYVGSEIGEREYDINTTDCYSKM